MALPSPSGRFKPWAPGISGISRLAHCGSHAHPPTHRRPRHRDRRKAGFRLVGLTLPGWDLHPLNGLSEFRRVPLPLLLSDQHFLVARTGPSSCARPDRPGVGGAVHRPRRARGRSRRRSRAPRPRAPCASPRPRRACGQLPPGRRSEHLRSSRMATRCLVVSSSAAGARAPDQCSVARDAPRARGCRA